MQRSTHSIRMLTAFSAPRLSVRYPRYDAARRQAIFERAEPDARIWAVPLP